MATQKRKALKAAPKFKTTSEVYRGEEPAHCDNCTKKISRKKKSLVVRNGGGRVVNRFCNKNCQRIHGRAKIEESGIFST